MSARMTCDCGWSGEVTEPRSRPRCPACHAPLDIPPLPPDPFAEALGPAPKELPAAQRLALLRRPARALDEEASGFATAEADEEDSEEGAPRRTDRYRPGLILSAGTLSALGLLLIGGVWLAVDLSRNTFPVFPVVFLTLGLIRLVRAFRGAAEP